METLKSIELKNNKLVDLPREMNLSEVLTEYPIPLEYDSCLVILSHHGENAATQGTQTRPYNLFWVVDNVARYMVSPYVSLIMSADEARKSTALTWGGSNGSYFSVSNRKIIANSLTHKSYYFAKGNSLYYATIPYDFYLGNFIL